MVNKNRELKNGKKIKIKLKTVLLIGIIICLIVICVITYIIIKNNKNKSTVYNNSNKTKHQSIIDINELLLEPVEKPIIYLYPNETIELSVTLGKPENVTCSYPDYKSGWNVIAHPNGTLVDMNTGRELYSLYWEGVSDNRLSNQEELKEGFVVRKDNLIDFLEEKLAILGLNEKEAEEFIVYWLPKLQENEYNYIRFATMEEINEIMPLDFSVRPDTLIRVLMQYKHLDNYTEVAEQKIETPERHGFTAVEWGGTEIK